MKKRDVLIIAEGPDDSKVMKNILSAYSLFDSHSIYEYSTNIYVLYDILEEESGGDWEDLNILLALKSREGNENKKQILSKRYTDIILVFDFDPQHSTYEKIKIERLMRFFNKSDENGKLFIDYPMIESYYHLMDFPNDLSYKYRQVTKQQLVNHEYKELVDFESKSVRSRSGFKFFDRGTIDKIMDLNLMKANYILNGEFVLYNGKSDYNNIDFMEILLRQAISYKEYNVFFVLCSCIFYVLDYKLTIE